jgi:hypothetical protein
MGELAEALWGHKNSPEIQISARGSIRKAIPRLTQSSASTLTADVCETARATAGPKTAAAISSVVISCSDCLFCFLNGASDDPDRRWLRICVCQASFMGVWRSFWFSISSERYRNEERPILPEAKHAAPWQSSTPTPPCWSTWNSLYTEWLFGTDPN